MTSHCQRHRNTPTSRHYSGAVLWKLNNNLLGTDHTMRATATLMFIGDEDAELIQKSKFYAKRFYRSFLRMHLEEILAGSSELFSEEAPVVTRSTSLSGESYPRLDSVPWDTIEEIAERTPCKARTINVRKS